MGDIRPNDTGIYKILGVGGHHDSIEDVEGFFATWPEPEEPVYRMDTDGDGIPDTSITLKPAPMPQLGPLEGTPEFSDPGFIMETPGPEDSEEFKQAVRFAEENGLTAVLVEKQSGSADRLNTVFMFPEVIYLDPEGNQVENPPGAPDINFGFKFSALDDDRPDQFDAHFEAGRATEKINSEFASNATDISEETPGTAPSPLPKFDA